MKTTIHLILLCALAGIMPAWAANPDLEIHIQPKQNDRSTHNQNDGSSFHSKEHWSYEVTVENKTFKELDALEVKYVIFYKQEKFGSKDPATAKRQNGNVTIGALKSHEKKTVTTSSVEIDKSALAGNYYFTNGGKLAAQDSLGGVWVRIYQNGQQIAEYANPSTLTKEVWE